MALIDVRLIRETEQGDQQQDPNEQPDIAAYSIGQMPCPEDHFRDFAFDNQIFFDSFWYDLAFDDFQLRLGNRSPTAETKALWKSEEEV